MRTRMRAALGILMVVISSCGAATPRLAGSDLSVDAGPGPSGCAVDGDCPTGMLCEGCPDGSKRCVPGCRTDADCGDPNFECNHQVQCLTCPCPSGLCDLSPCRDLDGDGFAAALTGHCPGKQVGDCDDANAATRPTGREQCHDGRDNDCDGLVDTADTNDCASTCDSARACNFFGCATGEFCEQGCCQSCPIYAPPPCLADQTLVPGGHDEQGCELPPRCVAACQSDGGVVCSDAFGTYDDACEVAELGAAVLHPGTCLWREGVACTGPGECPGSTVCRTFDGGTQRCTAGP